MPLPSQLVRAGTSPPYHREGDVFERGPHVLLALVIAQVIIAATASCRAAAQDVRSAGAVVGTTVPTSPVTLAQLLTSIRAQHPDIQAARARVRAAEGARVSAGTFANPVLGYEVDNTPFPGGRPLPATFGMEREAMTTVTLPLEFLYQRGARMQRAEAEVRAAGADAVTRRQRVALDAVHAYYRTALAQVSVDAARDLAAWLDTLVTYNRSRVDEGAAAEADLIRTELERDRADADATMQEADLARARAELAAFLGEASYELAAPNDLVVAVTDLPLPLVVGRRARGEPLATAPRALMDSSAARRTSATPALPERSEIRGARERLAAATAAVATERTMRLRQLGATVGAKQSGGATSLIAGVSLPLPLFDQNRGDIARAVAERETSAYELAAQERTVRAEVAGAREAARLLTDRALTLTRRDVRPANPPDTGGAVGASTRADRPRYLARADEARRIALGAYREGAVPLLQVLDAARAWGEARLAFYRTLYAQHESVAALLAAEGADLFTTLPALAASTQPRGAMP